MADPTQSPFATGEEMAALRARLQELETEKEEALRNAVGDRGGEEGPSAPAGGGGRVLFAPLCWRCRYRVLA